MIIALVLLPVEQNHLALPTTGVGLYDPQNFGGINIERPMYSSQNFLEIFFAKAFFHTNPF